MPKAPRLIFLVLALYGCSLAYSQSSTDPKAQTDVYLWKAPFETPDIAPFVDVPGYRFTLTPADKETSTRIKTAMKAEFPKKCGEASSTNWPIYQYDVGRDGRVFHASCIATSFDSWSVYYQITPQNKLKLLRFRSPVLSRHSKGSRTTSPTIIDYKELKVLRNSQIVQRRVVSGASLADTVPRYHDTDGKPHFWAEWVWKEGQGFALLKYSFMVYDKEKKVRKTTLYP